MSDIHLDTAKKLFGENPTKEQQDDAQALAFGALYGVRTTFHLEDPSTRERLAKIRKDIEGEPPGDLWLDCSPKEQEVLDRKFLYQLVTEMAPLLFTAEHKLCVAHRMEARKGKNECWDKRGNLLPSACGPCKRQHHREQK